MRNGTTGAKNKKNTRNTIHPSPQERRSWSKTTSTCVKSMKKRSHPTTKWICPIKNSNWASKRPKNRKWLTSSRMTYWETTPRFQRNATNKEGKAPQWDTKTPERRKTNNTQLYKHPNNPKQPKINSNGVFPEEPFKKQLRHHIKNENDCIKKPRRNNFGHPSHKNERIEQPAPP